MANFKLVGRPVPRHDAWAKVKGELQYSDDFEMPGMIYGKAVRSEYPAADIISIDTSAAKALPGVECVLTADDLMCNTDVTKFGQMRDVGGGFEGLYKVLAKGRVRYKSEPIALVAAATPELCEEAARLIKVEYDVHEGIYNPKNSAQDGGENMSCSEILDIVWGDDDAKLGSYQVSGDGDSNIVMKSGISRGNVEEAFQKADLIVENEYYVPPVDHVFLETEGGTCWIDENGVVTMRVGTQVLEHYRTIAKIMGLPHTKVRNMGVPMGGGFGGKEEITVETYLCMLAWYTRKPVKMVWSRQESLECHCKRHAEYMHYKTAFDKNGKMLAQKADIIMDAGGYTYLTPWVQMYSTSNAPGCYNVPNVEVRCISCLTNNTIASANRGFGADQVNVAYEEQMDEAAEKLGLSNVEIRKINCLHNGDELAIGFVPEGHVALDELIDMAWDEMERKYGPKKEYDEQGRRIGRGLAIGMMSYGRLCFMHDSARVAIRLELDGSITLRAGVPDLGGGQGAVICQLACEELGLPIEKAHVFVMDTHLTPLCGTTTATRQLYMSGNATLAAVKPLREAIINKAAELLDTQPQFVDLANEKAYIINTPEKNVPFVTVIAYLSNEGFHLENQGQFNAPFTEVPNLKNLAETGRILPDYTYSAHAAEVAVDEVTGQFEVTRIIAAYDVGRAINRNSCEGQLEGGAIYNMGYITEDMGWQNGYTKGNHLSTYLIPTAVDAPHVHLNLMESGGGLGPHGAKGVGEPADNSIAPAIVNALKDATGTRFLSFPIRPEHILDAVNARKAKEAK